MSVCYWYMCIYIVMFFNLYIFDFIHRHMIFLCFCHIYFFKNIFYKMHFRFLFDTYHDCKKDY